ncbi:hypothetical protein SAMN04515671_1962 [Nakamurella panacisegetis]|uniref:Uncharacterized protein n=1 Tax=Nakamurella panacisegetis TaxID=1090615 RepID=A0A1H0MAR9_9ACTN|nr:hypothetical protein SAMN04515671_1962 [Nakamurella panacisegetis]
MLIVSGLFIIPWLIYLSFQLPGTVKASNWSTMWIGLDVAEAIGLIVTGILQWRRSRHRSLPAAFTSALMALDAWIDMTTSAAGSARTVALVMGFTLEIPIAIACLVLAVATAPAAAGLAASTETRAAPAPTEFTTPAAADTARLNAAATARPNAMATVKANPSPPAATTSLTRSITSTARRRPVTGPSA